MAAPNDGRCCCPLQLAQLATELAEVGPVVCETQTGETPHAILMQPALCPSFDSDTCCNTFGWVHAALLQVHDKLAASTAERARLAAEVGSLQLQVRG